MKSPFIPISITPKAMVEIKHIMDKKSIPEGYGLRVGIKGAGCAGISFLLGFDKKKEGDNEYITEHIPVYIAKKHVMYLIGKMVDYHHEDDASGFIFVDEEKK